MYCMKCGKELQEGVPCNCIQQEVNEPEIATQKEESQSEVTKQLVKKNTFERLVRNFGLLFSKPIDAIKDVIQNKRWANAIIYVIIFSFIMGMSSTISTAWNSLKYYNSAVKSAKESYDEAQSSFRKNSSYYNSMLLNIAENTLEIAKENRIKRLTSGSFIFGLIGEFIRNFIVPVLSVVIAALLLLLMGKMFNGKGTFSQILAGIGLVYNIKYVSSFIIPIFSGIPFIGRVFSAASVGIAAVYAILVFFVVKECSELDDNKNVWSVFFALSVVTLLSTLILSI